MAACEADDLGDRRRAGLELGRAESAGEAVEGDVEDHPAAAEERGHGVEQLGPRPHSTPMPVGPSILWPREGQEVDAQRGHVGGEVGHVLAGVDARPGRRRRGRRRRSRAPAVRVPSTFDMAVTPTQLGAVEQAVEVGEVELAVGGERDPADLEALLGLELEPRDDVGVVLHLGEHARRRRGRGWPAPHERATRLSASVAFLVKTTSSGLAAPMKRATAARAAS